MIAASKGEGHVLDALDPASPSHPASQARPGLELRHAMTDVVVGEACVAGCLSGSTTDRSLVVATGHQGESPPRLAGPGDRVRCHIIISKSKPPATLVSSRGGREGGAPRKLYPTLLHAGRKSII